MQAMVWPPIKMHTKRNLYVTPILACCVVLRRLAAPACWRDLEKMFCKHALQLSKIFWEAVEHFVHERQHLITDKISGHFVSPKVENYAQAIYDKSNALSNCIGFIDGTVIGIARPKGSLAQHVVYNGHKRKYALNCQAVIRPDGSIQHFYGPLDGRRHDCTLYVKSKLEGILPAVWEVDGVRYCIYKDSGLMANGSWGSCSESYAVNGVGCV